MSTTSSRLGLTLPDGPDDILRVPHFNNNWSKLDSVIDSICTASTRPSTPFVGQRCYETDTKRFIVCTSIGPAVWRYISDAGAVASVAERNALVPYEGLKIFRSDKNWIEEYIATAWRIRSMPLVATFSDVTDPATGQMIIYTADMTIRRWSGSAWVIVVESTASGGEFTIAGSAGASLVSLSAGANTLITGWSAQTTLRGISHSAGVFTVTNGGIWNISASLRFSASAGLYMWFTKSGSTDQRMKTSIPSGTLELAAGGSVRLADNDTFRLYVWSSGANNVTRETTGDVIPALHAYRVGN
jgi:hypothetical protein